MTRRLAWMLVATLSTPVFADELVTAPELSAARIVEKNLAARGGLEAWRKIQSMVWSGHIERAGAGAASLSYVLQQKRPNKTRFEIMAKNQISTRVYDGAAGWKLSPANGRPALQAFTAAELSFARDGQGIDGELADYQAKGIAVTLDGVDEVEGRKAYRLNVKRPSGATHHLWIDAQSFLDVKYDRQASGALGDIGTVSVYYRNYQEIEGLQIPRLIESGSDSAKATDKMVIDKVSLNLPLDDQIFAKPRMHGERNAVDIGSPRALRHIPPWPAELSRFATRQVAGATGRR